MSYQTIHHYSLFRQVGLALGLLLSLLLWLPRDCIQSGTLLGVNSTFTTNQAHGGANDGDELRGAIFNYEGEVAVRNSTLALVLSKYFAKWDRQLNNSPLSLNVGP